MSGVKLHFTIPPTHCHTRVQQGIDEVTSFLCNDVSGSIEAPVICYSKLILRFFNNFLLNSI